MKVKHTVKQKFSIQRIKRPQTTQQEPTSFYLKHPQKPTSTETSQSTSSSPLVFYADKLSLTIDFSLCLDFTERFQTHSTVARTQTDKSSYVKCMGIT